MVVRVILVISKRNLGEFIQQTLQETGRYQAELVDGAAHFFSRVQTAKFSVAILDYRDIKAPQSFTRTLLEGFPKLKIVAFPPQESAVQSTLSNLGVSGWLSMPFNMPNLLDTLQGKAFYSDQSVLDTSKQNSLAIPAHAPEKSKPTSLAPEWLGDVNRVAQHLTHLFLESTAQAAFITRGSQIWAYAGQLPRPAVEELSRTVVHHGSNGGGDLTRFIRLNVTNSDHMLYATSLGGDYILALAFETEVSFMEMRSQVEGLAQKLSDSLQEWPNLNGDVEYVRDVKQEQDAVSNNLDLLVPLSDELPAIPLDWRPDQDIAEDRQAFFEGLLTPMSIPVSKGPEFEQGSIPAEAINRANDEQPVDPFLTTHPARIKKSSQTSDTLKAQPRSLRIDDLEPETASMVNIAYTSVLIPRLPQHHLVGGLAEALPRWVNELSFAFGWRLDHLSVRPNYLHWRAIAPPHYPPARMVHDLATQTSQRIFAEFSRLAKANPSRKFWAAGHLIVSSRDKLSQQLVQDFILAARTRQGLRS